MPPRTTSAPVKTAIRSSMIRGELLRGQIICLNPAEFERLAVTSQRFRRPPGSIWTGSTKNSLMWSPSARAPRPSG